MDSVLAALEEHDGFVIVGHRDPDGDSLGSSLALGLALQARGKKVIVISADPPFGGYTRLPNADQVVITKTAPDGYPVAVVMECNGVARTGVGGFDGRLIINIDHHANNPEFGDVNWVDPGVAATGVMIYRLLQKMGAEITPEIATHIYVAILTDTGSFRYSNTDAEAFRVSADLLEAGVDAAFVAEAIYEKVRADKVRLLGAALETLTFELGDTLTWMVLRHDVLFAGSDDPDTDGIVNQAKAIDGVAVSILFKEVAVDRFRASLRSDGSVDVAAIAGNFAGGGHPRAAGCMIEGNFQTARETLLSVVREALQS